MFARFKDAWTHAGTQHYRLLYENTPYDGAAEREAKEVRGPRNEGRITRDT